MAAVSLVVYGACCLGCWFWFADCLFVAVGGFRGFSLGFCLGGGWVAFDCVCCV